MDATDRGICRITSANKGIGFEIARQLGKAGVQILVSARDRDRGEDAATALGNEGIAARYVQIDLAEPRTMFNNAGIAAPGDGRRSQAIPSPPSMMSSLPTVNAASSDAKNRMVCATSRGWPNRPAGTRLVSEAAIAF